jgi:hypothetical protein
MPERLVTQTVLEFFREQVATALEHQRVSTSAFTEYYLVNLLTRCLEGDPLPAPEEGYDETPLAILYARALAASRLERARLLRTLGDAALFISGFFSDSVNGRLVDLDYYHAMGGRAYARLSHEDPPLGIGADVFSELAERFPRFADVLSEVSETTHLTTNLSILRLYERWIQTGSRRAASLLAKQGITPVSGGEGGIH